MNQYLDYKSTWSVSDRCLKEHGEAWWKDAAKLIGEAWGDPEEKRMVKMPLTLVVGRAWM